MKVAKVFWKFAKLPLQIFAADKQMIDDQVKYWKHKVRNKGLFTKQIYMGQ